MGTALLTSRFSWRMPANVAVTTVALIFMAGCAFRIASALVFGAFESESLTGWFYAAIWLAVPIILTIYVWSAEHFYWWGEQKRDTKQRFSRLLFFVQDLSRGWMIPFTTRQVTAAVFWAVALFAQGLVPRTVDMPEDKVFIMRDGTVIGSGEKVVVDRYQRSGSVIGLDQGGADLTVLVSTPSGMITVTATTSLVLREGDSLTALLRAGNSQLADADGQRVFFTKRSCFVLTPQTATLVRKIQAGEVSGSKASMVATLGAMVQADRANMPGWVKTLKITDVRVDGWQLQD